MTFRLSLAERMRRARYKRSRYARDPEFRLARVNHWRVKAGKPPLESADQIGVDLSRVAREKRRGPNGRFV